MRTETEIQESINNLRSQLGMEVQSEPVAPTVESDEDIQTRIDALNQKLAATPMSRREFMEKRLADDQMSLGQKAYQFGSGAAEGFSMLYDQGKDAVKEFYQGLTEKDFDGDSARVFAQTLGAIGEVGAKDFWQFGKTIIGSIGDELGGYTKEEEIEREYQRYLDNHEYHNVVREEMLDDVEYRKIADFGANFIDPFMLFPVAKLGSIGLRGATKGVQKAATGIAYSARNAGAANIAKFARKTAQVAQKADRVVDVVGKVGAYPTEMASRLTAYGLRKGVKGTSAVAGLGLKGVGKVGAGVEAVASTPRKLVEKGIKLIKPEGTEGLAVGGQVVGAFTGTIPGALELGITEGIGAIAKTLGNKTGSVLSVLGESSANKRFLHRLATSDKVSEATRKRAMWAYTHYGTSIGDAMFNVMANSLTLGGINAGLAGIAGEDARATGSAFGSGALAGMIPVGQEGMRGGKTDVQRDNRSIDQYMKEKLAIEQRKEFSKLPRHTQVLIATLQESGIGAPDVMMVEPQAYLKKLNADRAKENELRVKNGNQPLPMFDRAPSGHYEQSTGTIYMNADKLKNASLVGVEAMTHEIGHDYMHKALGQDPAMLELILERYKTTKDDPKASKFYMMTDKDGNGIGEPIYLNEEATTFRQDYDRVQQGIKIGVDAKLLAQEIGAEQFAMNFVQEPNVLKQIHPRMRRHILEASRKLLSKVGVVEPKTGNLMISPISKEMRKNPAIEQIYKNYGAMRAFELDDKANLAKDGILIEPKQGQTGEARYTQLFGGIGLKLRDAKNLVITNKGLLRELLNMKKRWEEEPSDGWSVKRGQLEGKQLTQDLRTIFTRNDPFGSVANIIDALQQAIDERIGIRFGYRSGTKGKYQNPFRLRDVAIYGWQVGSLGGKGRATLKVLGYDQAVVRQNVQVLVDKGYIKNPDQFMLELAEQGQKALQDPEGRINPEGRGENELMTVAFGLKESSDQVRSEGLKALLESKAVNKSFRSYDVEALAGLTKGQSKAFAFDYYNIRNNYNPFRGSSDNLYIPAYHGTPHTFTPEADAPYGRFRTDKIGTGEGAQAYGHGLYFASNKAVADWYQKKLTKGGKYEYPDGVESKYKPKLKKLEDKITDYNTRLIKASDERYDLGSEITRINYDILTSKMDNPSADIRSKYDEKERINDRIKELTGEIVDLRDLRDDYEKQHRIILTEMQEQGTFVPTQGSLYKVELAPENNELLDYDLGFFDQPEFVQNILQENGITIGSAGRGMYTGRQIYESLAFKLGSDKLASEKLREVGIRGIKYLDGSSRTRGKGDYNYVIFDEGDVQITEKLFRPFDDDPEIAKLREQLEFLGGDEMIQGFKAQPYLNRDETADYLRNLLTYRQEQREITNQLGVDPEKKPLRANMLAKEKGFDMTPFEQSSKALSEFQLNSAYRAKFRTMAGENDILFRPSTEESDMAYQISTRNPTAGNRAEDPVASNLVITLDDIIQAPGMAESYAKAINRYPGFKATRAKPDKVIARFVDMVMDNLLHLFDSVDPEIRERSKLWYVGARKIAIQFAEEYGFSTQAVAATMAATSPQTDWYKNVDRARRILETVRDEQDTIFNEDMASRSVAVANKKDKASATALAKSMTGKPFKELTIPQQAIFIRSFDELYRDRVYQIISPEGEFMGPALKDNGEIDKYSWLSYNQITKALSALADDSKANISAVMGEAHKIRNFYNNILLPFEDKMAVTIDTHAVAAGLLRPLASKDLEVANMLGAKPKGKGHASIKNSSVAGISGLYGIYAEAYRKAAEARGVLPREMQSITWEAIRGLYPKEIKQPKFKQQINDLFKDYENAKITIDELRAKVFQKAGGIDPPSWYTGGDSAGENRPRSSGDSQASGATSDEGKLFLPSVRRLGASNRPRGVRAAPSRASASGVNSFMMATPDTEEEARASVLDRFRN